MGQEVTSQRTDSGAAGEKMVGQKFGLYAQPFVDEPRGEAPSIYITELERLQCPQPGRVKIKTGS